MGSERPNVTWPSSRMRGRRHSARRDCALRHRREPSHDSLRRLTCKSAIFLSMCDDTGLFQHAVHSVPDRSHGYCVDDNARALLLACALNNPGEPPLPEVLTARFAAFVQHAWNPDTRRFRNFMGFDRRWLEDSGSEDSHGRTLWALGECARSDASPSRRRWAASPCSPRHCRPRRPLARRAHGPSRCWVWTPIAPRAPDDLHAGECPASACRQADVQPGDRSRRRTGCGSRKGWPTTTRACRRL